MRIVSTAVVFCSIWLSLQPGCFAAASDVIPLHELGWSREQDGAKFETGVLASERFNGHREAFIKSVGDATKGWSSVDQEISALPFRGKRIIYSGQISTDAVSGWAGLWMRIDNGTNVIGFDNMQTRTIKGTSDWKQYAVVLDVPKDALLIKMGFTLCGGGSMRVCDLSVKEATANDAVTGEDPKTLKSMLLDDAKLHRLFRDPKFEIKDSLQPRPPHLKYWHAEGDSRNYDFEINATGGVDKSACVSVKSKPKSRPYGMDFVQEFGASAYRGKRMRFSCYIKTENAEPGAATWMGIGSNAKTLAHARTYASKTPAKSKLDGKSLPDDFIEGTTPWKKYSLVLEVPQEATRFRVGLSTISTGIVRFSKVMLDEVDKSIPETKSKLKLDKTYAQLVTPHFLDFEHE